LAKSEEGWESTLDLAVWRSLVIWGCPLRIIVSWNEGDKSLTVCFLERIKDEEVGTVKRDKSWERFS